MSKQLNIFSSTGGLNAVDPPHKVQLNYQKGLCELVIAENVDISDAGLPATRLGITKVLDGSFTAIESAGNFCLAERDENLVFITRELSETVLLAGSINVKFASLDGRIYFYYKNGVKGFVESNGIIQPWEYTEEYDGDGRFLTGPPVGGDVLCYHLGSIFISIGTVCYYSDQYAPNVFSLATNYFDLGVTIHEMISHYNVLYVNADNGIYAISGVGSNMESVKISEIPALIGSMSKVIDFGESKTVGVLCTTNRGVLFLSANKSEYIGQSRLDSVEGNYASAYTTKTHYYCAINRS